MMTTMTSDSRDSSGTGRTPSASSDRAAPRNAMFDCGWGRLIFADTFADNRVLADALRAEGPDRRDIAFNVRDPHLLLAAAPQELFLDPSDTYRLVLADYEPTAREATGVSVRRLSTRDDAEAVNVIYASRQMVSVPPDFFWTHRNERALTVLVAEDDHSGEILGTVTGVDHALAIGDPDGRTSLWCLAVAPDARHPGIGEALVRALIEQYRVREARALELSVMHDNEQAIRLYKRLGFQRVRAFSAKRKNPFNEALFTGPAAARCGAFFSSSGTLSRGGVGPAMQRSGSEVSSFMRKSAPPCAIGRYWARCRLEHRSRTCRRFTRSSLSRCPGS